MTQVMLGMMLVFVACWPHAVGERHQLVDIIMGVVGGVSIGFGVMSIMHRKDSR